MTTMTTDAQPSVRLVATDELGIVRVAQAPSTQALGSLSMTHRWGDASRARRIVTCRAGEAGDDVSDDGLTTCAANGWLAVGRHDATVEVIDGSTGGAMGGGPVNVGGAPVSVGVFGPTAGRPTEARLVTVTEAGDVVVHAAACDASVGTRGAFGEVHSERIVEEWREATRFRAIEHAASAVAAAGGAVVALGGKGQGNDLKMWDVEAQKMSFKAKPPPPNWLGYRAPPWVSALHFVPNTDHKSVLVGTGEHQLRLYDVRADKRAVVDMSVGEAVITSLALSHDANTAYVANNHGQLNSVDLRKRALFAKFKGNSGSIRQIVVHPTEPLIATAGLDRYLRVYSLDTRKCMAAAYMKQALSGVAWDVRGPAREAAEAAAMRAAEERRAKKAKKGSVAAASSAGELKPKKKKKTKTRVAEQDELAAYGGEEYGHGDEEEEEAGERVVRKRAKASSDDGAVPKKKKKKASTEVTPGKRMVKKKKRVSSDE